MKKYWYLAEMNFLQFDWIEEYVIAASSSPYIQKHFDTLEHSGIKVIIDLRKENEYDVEKATLSKFHYYHIPIVDGDIPTKKQVEEFWLIYNVHFQKEEAIVIHCIAGCGRTGTMLALWFMLTGKYPNPEQAISELRKIRYCSVENTSQEYFVKDFTESDLDMIRAVVKRTKQDGTKSIAAKNQLLK